MLLYNLAIENREILKLVFSAMLVLACFIIVLRTHRLFKLTDHEGIRYFRNSFLFFGLAFATRYFLNYSGFLIVGYEFFLMSACLFLFYSLSWKRFNGENKISSLFNFQIITFYLIAFIVSILDYLWGVYYFVFFAQIIVFSFAGGILFEKSGSGEKGRFLNLYLVVIFLNLFARITNLLISTMLDWNRVGVIAVYFLDAIIFLLFLYGIIKNTRE